MKTRRPIKIGAATKAPDFSFRVGGVRKFFVEAKKPFVNIKDDLGSSFQLRRYAWTHAVQFTLTWSKDTLQGEFHWADITVMRPATGWGAF